MVPDVWIGGGRGLLLWMLLLLMSHFHGRAGGKLIIRRVNRGVRGCLGAGGKDATSSCHGHNGQSPLPRLPIFLLVLLVLSPWKQNMRQELKPIGLLFLLLLSPLTLLLSNNNKLLHQPSLLSCSIWDWLNFWE